MLDLLAAGTDAALVDFQIDIYWALVGGADPVALIRRLPGGCRRCIPKSWPREPNRKTPRSAMA